MIHMGLEWTNKIKDKGEKRELDLVIFNSSDAFGEHSWPNQYGCLHAPIF